MPLRKLKSGHGCPKPYDKVEKSGSYEYPEPVSNLGMIVDFLSEGSR
ncbi:hypothetical protein FHS68_004411 [Dyadobacter arcticus]|uniref:Uncharacterized protein n=1 Tax=Dyadobacter arcticus TaxID=1078754 RepID=A0ABX0UTH7_9BACT|nr:hypothetical protein [Dyadobacter arcticus]